MNYKITDDSGSVPHGSIIPDQQKTNPCRQWPEPLDIHPFVRRFSDREGLFMNHEIEYLKDNCENYPKDPRSVDKFKEMVDDIDLDEISEKLNGHGDDSTKFGDWNNSSREIAINNPFREERGNLHREPGMYESEDNMTGMFEIEEELDRLEELERIMKRF